MKYFIISLMLSLSAVSVHAQSLESEQDSVATQEVVEVSSDDQQDRRADDEVVVSEPAQEIIAAEEPVIVEASIHERLDKEIENVQRQTRSIKNSLHPEIVKNLPAIEQEAILALLKSQGEDLKALDTLLRESFNNLDPALQRDILLRLSER